MTVRGTNSLKYQQWETKLCLWAIEDLRNTHYNSVNESKANLQSLLLLQKEIKILLKQTHTHNTKQTDHKQTTCWGTLLNEIYAFQNHIRKLKAISAARLFSFTENTLSLRIELKAFAY